ncbi:MAG: histidine kinase [Thermoleophilia bacterium]|nr:histidine kinase [Thermoleophilia bacterium]
MLAVSAAVAGEPLVTLADDGRWGWILLDLLLGAAAFVLVTRRRRWPVPVALGIALTGLVSMSGTGPAMLALVSVATRRRWGEVLSVGVVAIVAGHLYVLLVPEQDGDPFWLTLFVGVVFTAALSGWGMYIGSRRELLWQLRDRAERAEAEQALRADRSRANERARIAREMHDVLAHRISQIAMHAGALAFREDLPAHELRRGAADIQQRANAALTDLRGVLGVLRDPDTGGAVDRPQPTFADVPVLVEECRAAGMAVDYAAEVAGAVPEALGRTAYRIVQEGLTNAGKHAPGAEVRVRLDGDPDRGLDVTVSNPLGFGASGTPGAGLGLVGLAERAQLSGGTLETRRVDGTFALHGWLPWPA